VARRIGWIALAALAVLAVVLFATWELAGPRLLDMATHRLLADRFDGMPPARNEMQPVRTIMVHMRDGVALSTDIYLPVGKGPWPTILVRDPYGVSQYVSCRIFVHYGYACVHQDVRGRYGSGGAWYPLINERNDGIDTLGWLVKQPWQNHRIALWGESYLGLVEWAVADKLPPEVKTFVAGVSHGDFYQMIYHNGMFMQGIAGTWSYGLFQSPMKLLGAEDRWKANVAGHIPAAGVDPKPFGAAWPSYHDYLMHPERDDPYWHSSPYEAIRDSYKGVHVPVMLFARSYDFFLPGMLKTFEALPTRTQSLLFLGPGEHGGAPGDLKVTHPHRRYYADTLAWFDHFLKGAPLPAGLAPGYNVYINGADRWQYYARWPGPAATQIFYLDRVSAAHGCEHGTLSPTVPATQAAARYRYDPRHPVPTRGGAYSVSASLAPPSSSEQHNDFCNRPDVLSFASAPLTKSQFIAGSIHAKLMVASSAPDTAFSVKLSEHFADGRILNIRDDISTLSLRNGAAKRLSYRPGDKVEIDFDMTPIAWQLQRGSRLRLDISSSNFPVFNTFPNRAGLWSMAAGPAVAEQTVYGGSLALPFAR
jgi:hypothetical protein